jgi:hypothetical protein
VHRMSRPASQEGRSRERGMLVLSHEGEERSRVPRSEDRVHVVSHAACLHRSEGLCTVSRSARLRRRDAHRTRRLPRVSRRSARAEQEAGLSVVSRARGSDRTEGTCGLRELSRLALGIARHACGMCELSRRQAEGAPRQSRLQDVSSSPRTEGDRAAAGVRVVSHEATGRSRGGGACEELRVVPLRALRTARRSRDVHVELSPRSQDAPAGGEDLHRLSRLPGLIQRSMRPSTWFLDVVVGWQPSHVADAG